MRLQTQTPCINPKPAMKKNLDLCPLSATSRLWKNFLSCLIPAALAASIARGSDVPWDGGLTGGGVTWLGATNWVGDVVPGSHRVYTEMHLPLTHLLLSFSFFGGTNFLCRVDPRPIF